MAPSLPYRDINLLVSPLHYAFRSASSTSAPTLVVDRPSGDLRLDNVSVQGAKRVSSIAGILGIINLKLDKYIIIITKARPMGRLRGHMIYNVVSSEFLPVRERPLHDPDEDTYLSLLKQFLQNSPIYFSYSLDITNSFQRQSQSDPSAPLWKRADDRFFWNRFIQTDLIDFRSGLTDGTGIRYGQLSDVDPYILPVMYGMLRITPTQVKSTPFTFALITRRSRHRGGTRYFSRGIDERGHVSNFNETEQILILNDSSGGFPGFSGGNSIENGKAGGTNSKDLQVLSFVQTRGSVPVYWSEVNNLFYVPRLQIRGVDTAIPAARNHFLEQVHIYGENYLVNLVNHKGREDKVKSAYEQLVRTLVTSSSETREEDSLTTEKLHTVESSSQAQELDKLHYVYFDFHNETKGLKWHRAELLLNQLTDGLVRGQYFSGVEPLGEPSGLLDARLLQSSVVRTNCMDCLDRTNVVQSMLGRWTVTRQLVDAGVLKSGESASDDVGFESMFRNVWADNADVVSKSYSGTGALKTDFTRTGQRTKAGILLDGNNSLTRYIRNNFYDGPRQDAFDVFLGTYLPSSSSSSRLVFADRRPIIIQAIPYILAASAFMVLVATFSRRLPDAAAWPIRLFLIIWMVVGAWCLRFIYTHGMLYVNWPKLNTPAAATEGYLDALHRAHSDKVVGRFVPVSRHQRGFSNDAIVALNSLQSNFSIVQEIQRSGGRMNKQAMAEMVDWCKKIGYQPSDFNKLNLIHIAGTKGKGSTCAFISSILSQYISPSDLSRSKPKINKIGLYTSPHLRFVRERIQINNIPLSEELFAQYFFQIWDRLEEYASQNGIDPADPSTKPIYFRYLTLMAWHVYLNEGVDAAIIECGIGGEYDSTNILDKPIVTGITSLGIDHVELLGDTIEKIAWHKAGVIKSGSITYTAPQPEAAMDVLIQRGDEKGVKTQVAAGHPEFLPGKLQLGLSGDFQYKNAELAVAISTSFLKARGIRDVPSYANHEPLTPPILHGLKTAYLGGRCEIKQEENVIWHIDGGHTPESIEATGLWFSSLPYTRDHDKTQVLIFNQQTRDSSTLVHTLHDILATRNCVFTHAIFCTNVTFERVGYRPDLVSINTNAAAVQQLSVQENLAKIWSKLSPDTKVVVKNTVEEAVKYVRDLPCYHGTHDQGTRSRISTLVTGSLHLVGGLIEVLEAKVT
ncbi:Phosphoinositide phosphatase sac1 [Ophidiomyces ophidiicola]|uniref:Phosphoinositide phosphatase sac1 n=1 Tax=Ophidiomyces ophidiicola TaxID=1387563 RepID=A0ACB8V1K4_9EURO|nr:Phosphoinositide phosphatase sac1 [Ophidiomyces ophidiicola]KAI1919052.1 Phosphoinositide phosphatase sac1 [Ophidiomyces ophidiicola]KAI1924965.1 Phosphoinositide phosphatase sac1 [Ophidiomyces ophidiicola]KAI1952172.1 Phosphoinositide phosphatase sac1 [Ophidiomyces ophidiicola]KAI1960551.1 Phosphoinositide phosphatase sac1 [Ophidiomyces ophidiicola]